jgi:TRAP-type uncharacterized transport system substrate-binding protein
VQAFQDGQFDVLVGAFPIGAAAVQQLALQRKIRIIGVPDEVLKTAAWAKYLDRMGETNATIAPKSYDGQVNNDQRIKAAAYAMVLSPCS